MAKKIDIGSLSQAQQDRIQTQIDEAKKEDLKAEAIRAKQAVEFYREIKGEIEKILLAALKQGDSSYTALRTFVKQLEKMPNETPSALSMRADGDTGWSKSKILKQISLISAKKPTTDDGYIKAARDIESGKPKRISKAIREKRALKRKQSAGREILFDKKVSTRKTSAVAKNKAIKPKTK